MSMMRHGALPMPRADPMEGSSGGPFSDELWRHRQAFDDVILDWASSLTVPDLAGDIAWFSLAIDRDVVRSRTLVVMHILNHQTHHRGQAHALITRAGEATGDVDLTFVLPE